jgi:hypothetical protein
MASSLNASTSGGGGVIVTSDASGNLDIQSGGSTVVAVTSTGATVTGTLAATGASTFTGTGKFATTIGVGAATPSASGAGITFPATQSASSDANTLDDYEEGTFTPTLAFNAGSVGITYSKQLGYYTRVGNVVNVSMYLALSNKGTSTGNAVIAGLPFGVKNTSGFYPGGAFRIGTATGLTGAPQFYTPYGGTSITLEVGGAGTALTNANFSNTTDICWNYIYQTD